MTSHPPSQRGLTLIELIVFIVVVSVGLVGILSVFNLTVAHSADPMVQKQMLAIAESTLEEILLKDFADPTGACTASTAPRCKPNTPSDRQNYNDVGDYAGFATTGIYDIDGSPIPTLADYKLTVAVDATTALGALPAASVKHIAVTVTHGADTLTLDGFRTDYGG